MQNTPVDNKIKELKPHFVGLAYDLDNGFIRLSFLFPFNWKMDILENAGIILNTSDYDDGRSYYMLGLDTDTDSIPSIDDKPIDYFLDLVKELIDFNLQEEKKKQLIEKKMQELSQYLASASLDDLEKFNPINKIDLIQTKKDGAVIVDNEVISTKKVSKNK